MSQDPEANRREFLASSAAVAGAALAGQEARPAQTGEDLIWKPATELAALIRTGKLSPVELTQAILKRIDAVNPKLRAYLHVDHEGALAAARDAERGLMQRRALGPLHGVPVSIKDGTAVRGMPNTNGSRITGNAPAKDDAYLTRLTREAGAVILGKTNLPAFAHIDITQNLLGPNCPTPWNLEYNSGGSSGGAGAACAAGMGPLHHGSDGGGSIRIPADRCGIYGFKPSVGRIGHPGAIGAGCGVGHDGPMTRTVADSALLMDVWAGPSKLDYLSIDSPAPEFSKAVKEWEKALKGKKVGITFDYGWIKAVDPEVKRLVGAAAKRFTELGCIVEEVSPNWPNPLREWEAFWYTTAASKRHLFKDHPDWIDATLVPQMDAGAKITGVEMAEALAMKDRIFQSVQRFFDQYDLLLSPVCAVPTFPFDKIPMEVDGTPATYLEGRVPGLLARMPFTPTFNMTGNPAASAPAGFTKDGLPVGLHIIGGWHQDALVLQASAGFETIQPWAAKKPKL